MPSCVTAFSQAAVSIQRIDSFLNNESDLYPALTAASTASTSYKNGDVGNGNGNNGNLATSDVSNDPNKRYAVLLKNCYFARNPRIPVQLNQDDTSSNSLENTSLKDISLAIQVIFIY